MVSELAGEEAIPPQLPAPTRRLREIAKLRDCLRRPIYRIFLLRRGVTILKSASRVHSVASFNLRRSFNFAARFLQRRAGTGAAVNGGGGLAIVNSVKQDYLHAIDSFSLLFLPINEDRSAMLLFQSSISHSIFVKFLSKVLISPLFIVFNRSRSENSSSKVLDYPPSVAFNHNPCSRSMESVGESMSTVLISSTSVVIVIHGVDPWQARRAR
nr:ferritin-3, chloroplastic-like [Ipomoea trifida]